jgi:hypothetical protein
MTHRKRPIGHFLNPNASPIVASVASSLSTSCPPSMELQLQASVRRGRVLGRGFTELEPLAVIGPATEEGTVAVGRVRFRDD